MKQKLKSVEIDLYQKTNMRIGKIASSAEYRMDKQFQNFQLLEPNFDFSNWKKSRNFSIFQFPIWTKTSNLENSKNFQFQKFRKFAIWQIQKNSIGKFQKICNLEN